MNVVIAFPRRLPETPHGWASSELSEILSACADTVAAGQAAGWELGRTEAGDPQVYLLGPEPEGECLLCISRIGSRYLVEDGRGRLLFEHHGSRLSAEAALAALRRRKAAFMAQITLGWYALRETFEERTDALVEESSELLVYMLPPLAVLV